MKKLIMGMMIVAGAFAAFCEDTAAQPADNNPLVVSENLFGSIRVDTKSEFTMVAAPFEGFASQFKGDPEANAILARDVVAVEKLIPTDTMSIFNPDAADAKEEFDNYIARKASVTVGTGRNAVTYEYMEWLASMWFDEENMTSNKFPDPDKRLVPTGSGVFIGREVSSLTSEGFSVYAYGQIPQSFPAGPIEIGAGKTMLCPPGELAYGDVNVNELSWADVKPVTGTPIPMGTRKAVRVTASSITNADRIKYYVCDNAKATEYTLYFYNGEWYRFTGGNLLGYNDLAVIPAGQSFWYVRSGEGTAKLQW